SLAINSAAQAKFTVLDRHNSASTTVLIPMRQRCWYLLLATYDAKNAKLRIGQRNLAPLPGETDFSEADAPVGFFAPDLSSAPITIAASLEKIDGNRQFTSRHFDGKIEAPLIRAGAADFDSTVTLAALRKECLANWDFSLGIDSQRVEDVSGNGRHGRCVNLPTRAVTGHNWCGQTQRWLDRPDLYGAIHFHCDDLHDMQWESDFKWTIPAELPSGIYAAQVTCAHHGEDIIPFFVLPPKGTARVKVAFL